MFNFYVLNRCKINIQSPFKYKWVSNSAQGKNQRLVQQSGCSWHSPKFVLPSLLNTLRSVCCCWIYFSDLIECKKYKLPHQTLIIMGEFTFVTKYYMYLCALQMHKCCHGPISAYETIDMYTKNSTSLSRHVLRNTILICLFYTTLTFQRLETSLRTMNN